MQHAFQSTLILSILYAIFKFFDIDFPSGTAFISYIIPKLLTDVVLIVFPLLFIFFYFKDGDTVKDIINKNSCQSNDIDIQTVLREYHSMLKEGIITQDEFDAIKKKNLKKINDLPESKERKHPHKSKFN